MVVPVLVVVPVRQMYVRGAAPDGPVAWALADAALRNVRWLEHPDLQLKLNMSREWA